MIKKYAPWIIRHAGWVATFGLISALISGYFSVFLFKNLKTDLEELLPTTSRSVLDLNEVTSRLESTESLTILVFSDHPQESKKFIDDLAQKLEEAPKDQIASIEYRIKNELSFFQKRRSLFIDVTDLKKIKQFIEKKINYETELYNPLNIFNEVELPEPQLDINHLKQKYEGKVSAYTRFPDGYYATPDEKIRVLLVNLPGKLSGIEGALKLKKYVDNTLSELNPKSYAPDLDVKFTGGVQNLIEEHTALIDDLGFSTLLVILLVTLSMLLYYQNVRATCSLIASLLIGTLWTFGIAYPLVGYLNANSAFLGSIVIGNGINFGIIFLARYIEERKKNYSNLRATMTSVRTTAKATLTAALAAGLAYGSLMLTEFRGFKQFGIIGFIGMILCWISAFTLLPAFLTLFDKKRSFKKTITQKNRFSLPFADWISYLVEKHSRMILFVSIVGGVLAVLSIVTFKGDILLTDLSKMRDKRSLESGSAYLSKFQDEVFDRYLSPLVILPKSIEDTLKIREELIQTQKRLGADSNIVSVLSIHDFIPNQQIEKIKILKEIKKSLPPNSLKRLSKNDSKLINELLAPEGLTPFELKGIPASILQKFTEKDGTLGKLILVEPPLGTALWDKESLKKFIASLRSAADSVTPGTAVAGQTAVTSDMFEAISRDGPRATLFAFLAVVLLSVFLFNNIRIIVLVLFSLLMGVFWMTGIIFAFDLKINFLNFIALPITFGIGVDYGVNIFHRYRLDGRGSVLKVIKKTGSAVALASLTTIIGFGTLLLAGNQAFVSFGKLAVIGEITCLFAAMVTLPAMLFLQDAKYFKRLNKNK